MMRLFKIESENVAYDEDISMVIISLISCLVALGTLGSVGVGTIIAAVLVGSVLGVITGWFGEKRDKILKGTPSE